MFNFACKDTNNSQTTNYFWEFLYSLKWIFDHVVTPCLAPCDNCAHNKFSPQFLGIPPSSHRGNPFL